MSLAVNEIFSLVWKCSSDVHLSRFCTQFEPNDDSKLGWTVIGHWYVYLIMFRVVYLGLTMISFAFNVLTALILTYSDGTMSPTAAPNFMQLSEFGEGCPDKYEANRAYEAGDAISYTAANDRKVVYICKVSIFKHNRPSEFRFLHHHQ